MEWHGVTPARRAAPAGKCRAASVTDTAPARECDGTAAENGALLAACCQVCAILHLLRRVGATVTRSAAVICCNKTHSRQRSVTIPANSTALLAAGECSPIRADPVVVWRWSTGWNGPEAGESARALSPRLATRSRETLLPPSPILHPLSFILNPLPPKRSRRRRSVVGSAVACLLVSQPDPARMPSTPGRGRRGPSRYGPSPFGVSCSSDSRCSWMSGSSILNPYSSKRK